MPAGFKYDLKPIEASMPEMCRLKRYIVILVDSIWIFRI